MHAIYIESKRQVIKEIVKKDMKMENSPFPSYLRHVNPGGYQESDPRAKHRTQPVCHPHSLSLELIPEALHQWMPSSQGFDSPSLPPCNYPTKLPEPKTKL